MRRFYRAAAVTRSAGGFGVALDGKPMRTPAGRPLTLPSEPLAAAIAAEWQAQDEKVKPLTMPIMRLVATAIDRVAAERKRVVDEIAAYAASDLVCYRAGDNAELCRRQTETWQPLLDWLRRRYDVSLAVTEGVIPVAQPAEALARLRAVVAAQDDFALTALHALVTTAGSLVVALAMLEGETGLDAGYAASQLDELYQAEQWGEDAEAAARRKALYDDLAAALRFLALLRG
jgi:chaperone required for assembly of F1-ATPase